MMLPPPGERRRGGQGLLTITGNGRRSCLGGLLFQMADLVMAMYLHLQVLGACCIS